MSSTNFTKNLELSQFLGTDKPSWLGDVNNDMLKIDNAYGELHTATSSIIAGQLKVIDETLVKHGDQIAANISKIAVNTSSISTMAVQMQTINTNLQAVDTREREHFDTLSKNQSANNDIVEKLQEDNIYFRENMNKVESDIINAQDDVEKLTVRVDNLEKDVDELISGDTENKNQIATLKADLQSEVSKNLQQDTAIENAQSGILENNQKLANLTNRVSDLEKYPVEVETNTQDISNLKASVQQNANNITTAKNDITSLQTKTSGISDGVTVPFGFGTTASGDRGFKKADGTVQAFITDSHEQQQDTQIQNLRTDVQNLQTKTAGITSGNKLPYSLGIADGGAYGYIKNGELRVTPFVTEADVDKIVDLQPIKNDISALQTKTQNIESMATIRSLNSDTNKYIIVSSDTATLEGGKNYENAFSIEVDVGAESRAIKINDNGDIISSVNGVNKIRLPFSFGIDSNGNYGYIKAGADTVTPFLSLQEQNGRLSTIGFTAANKNSIDLKTGDILLFSFKINGLAYEIVGGSDSVIISPGDFDNLRYTMEQDLASAGYIIGRGGPSNSIISAIVIRNNIIIGSI